MLGDEFRGEGSLKLRNVLRQYSGRGNCVEIEKHVRENGREDNKVLEDRVHELDRMQFPASAQGVSGETNVERL